MGAGFLTCLDAKFDCQIVSIRENQVFIMFSVTVPQFSTRICIYLNEREHVS